MGVRQEAPQPARKSLVQSYGAGPVAIAGVTVTPEMEEEAGVKGPARVADTTSGAQSTFRAWLNLTQELPPDGDGRDGHAEKLARHRGNSGESPCTVITLGDKRYDRN